jgi:hypothetical protein
MIKLSKKQEDLQKHNNAIMKAITGPYDPAELQEIAELEGW